ncbi:hypothetical protein GJU39_15015 [Pedobacter petrophilus]|uniref:Tail specific protease domain-containing protein n=1 Tax=Pedobacter petrophilus TaxID=1908241 RepID=A0A7K0G338_9SPHI|nr:S41 family peptidase [Pedobacter petrophilus]MRX77396.1 hypothetical protein [Pedobacter petrophilus]
MKYLFLIVGVFFTIKASAQNCNCGDNFKYLTDRISKNYVGYADKVTPSNSQKFAKFTDSLQQVANKANPYKCIGICREWLDFFKDQHIEFGMDFNELNSGTVRSFFSNEEKTTWTDSSFKSYLVKNKATLDPVEGIWSYGIYEVGIVKDIKPDQFMAFVLKADSVRWMPQQVKFRLMKNGNQYEPVYFSGGDHSEQYPTLIKDADTLNFGMFGKWIKEEKKIQTSKSTAPDLVASFKVLDDTTALLTLPSFNSKYKLVIDSLITHNKNNLSHTKHLIVDVRDNPGGSTHCFEKLIPYLYTDPIHIDGALVLATADNIRDCYERNFPYASAASKRTIKRNNKKLWAHEGELYQLYKSNTIKQSKILKNPSQISILMNGNTASSGELFILRAEQSKKVTLFGQNTAGCADYGEIVMMHPLCKVYILIYPVAKSLLSIKRPLDNIGITPQVKIPANVTNWIDFVKNYKK